MTTIKDVMQDLFGFIHQTDDARELKRALAVKLTSQGTVQAEIMNLLLQVTSGFISKWKGVYDRLGANGLKLGYQGSTEILHQFFCCDCVPPRTQVGANGAKSVKPD